MKGLLARDSYRHWVYNITQPAYFQLLRSVKGRRELFSFPRGLGLLVEIQSKVDPVIKVLPEFSPLSSTITYPFIGRFVKSMVLQPVF